MATLANKIPVPVCSLAGNWWTFVLRGVLALILAVLAVLMPASALLGLTLRWQQHREHSSSAAEHGNVTLRGSKSSDVVGAAAAQSYNRDDGQCFS